jgi:hypothetical protein
MSPSHVPFTNAALADALDIVSRTPALDPPLYICNSDHHASVVQTLVLGPLPAPSAADTRARRRVRLRERRARPAPLRPGARRCEVQPRGGRET